ncbi:oxalate:formate antiporter [Cohnella abietis]|uniref:Uncharacterized protein n=1 Tax=Cohnella abietis TaxID=2507935 RepID=A0A3T1DAK3_9BACL|nr:oxalate:formate antiporter [Cohnella abietis]BBI35099.1 hypothetical protein KCTCHS21_44980 [Cohnella abietis]
MKKRDVVYMIYSEEERSITASGIEFNEFVDSLTMGLNNVLLLSSGYTGADFHSGVGLDFVKRENLHKLYKENIHSYGDFCWIDFDELASLDKLEPQEKAELLYLGHYKKVLGSLFFEKLNNQFVYLAHDDGWYSKVFYKNKQDQLDIFRHLFPGKLKIYKRNVEPMSLEVGGQLVSFAKEGLLIDFSKTIKSRTGLEIPLNVIGKIKNFDDVYNNMERHKARAKSEHWLKYKESQWVIKS